MRERIQDDPKGKALPLGVGPFSGSVLSGRGLAGGACQSLCVDDAQQPLDADQPDDGPTGLDPASVSAERFDAMVVDQLDLLPDDMVDGLDNIVFVTEDRPDDGSLDLLGLYDGVALTERGQYGFGELPDRIILYREPHLAAVDDEEALADEIHVTLVHEIAHFYGIDDEQLHELGWA
jgi:predicted Zn-dependent protease with MMP-like domain